MKTYELQRANEVMKTRTFIERSISQMWEGIARRDQNLVDDAKENYQIAKLVGREDLGMAEEDFEDYETRILNLPWNGKISQPSLLTA